MSCRVLRCSKQAEMYIYLRADLGEDDIPAALRERAGRLSEVMRLELSPQRRLARVDVRQLIRQLQRDGVYLQLPPAGRIQTELYAGD